MIKAYPRDGGAWWAAVYGVAQSRTRLKRLSSSSSSMFPETFVLFVSALCFDRETIVEETIRTVTDFIFLSSKITADGDCSRKIKRCLFLGRKTMTNLDSILKSRDVTMLTKILLVKAMVFPVVTYGCESWTIKKAEPKN